MKICSTCKVEKNLEDFYRCKTKVDGYQIICKECNNNNNRIYYLKNRDKLKNYSKITNGRYSAYNKMYIESKKDGYHYVYLLPEYNYVGYTSNLYSRMIVHKSNNRDISNYIVLGKFLDKEEALQVERSYHAKGFLGGK